jgi:hypothetical protein
MPQGFQLRVPSRLAHLVRSGAPTQLRAWAHHAKLAILTSEHQRAVAILTPTIAAPQDGRWGPKATHTPPERLDQAARTAIALAFGRPMR